MSPNRQGRKTNTTKPVGITRTLLALYVKLWRRRFQSQSEFVNVLRIVMAILAIPIVLISFLASFFIASKFLPQLAVTHILLIWLSTAVFYVYLRFMVTITTMQMGVKEVIALSNLLHLPVPHNRIFLLNFALSQFNLSNCIFLPLFIGVSIASMSTLSSWNAVWLFFAFSFVLLTGSALYQFSSWFESKFVNARRRNVIFYATILVFVIVSQFPLAYQVMERRGIVGGTEDIPVSKVEQLADESSIVEAPKDEDAFPNQFLQGWIVAPEQESTSPPWWTITLTVVLILLIILSLRRSYRLALNRYRLGQTNNERVASDVVSQDSKTPVNKLTLPNSLVKVLARLTVKTTMRSLQGKAALFNPVIFLVVIVMFFFGFGDVVSQQPYPSLILMGAIALMAVPQNIVTNAFGFDGLGLRNYVFAKVPMRTIIWSKLLALLPLFILISAILLILAYVLLSLSYYYMVVALFQAGVLFIAFCLMDLRFAIQIPYMIDPKNLYVKGSSTSGILGFLCGLLLLCALLLVAWGAYALEQAFGESSGGLPIYLIVSVIEFAIALACLLPGVNGLAKLLEQRATDMLDVFTQARQ